MKLHSFPILLLALSQARLATTGRVSEANPPPQTIIVQPGVGTLSLAFAQLTGKSGPQVFLLMPGQYTDNAVIQDYDDGVIIQGSGSSADTYQNNQVTFTGAKRGISDASATLAIYLNNVEVYGINFENTYGSGTDSQAVALIARGQNQVFGQCSFKSFQDTLYVKQGSQAFFGCYVEGSVDFIFGAARSYFGDCHIGILPNNGHQVLPQDDSWINRVHSITANAGSSAHPDSLFVIDRPTFTEFPGVLQQSTYYGRAWGSQPQVSFQYETTLYSLNPQGWDMKSAGSGPFDSAGFMEFPVVRGQQGHLAPRKYTVNDILPRASAASPAFQDSTLMALSQRRKVRSRHQRTGSVPGTMQFH